ncbi:L7Ae/L30e/S12e/Gadd45 family ribosomal protein [Peptoanaerobacter stomatis]|uniref:L7Ae/L30e/S12e/Gadd45 family ribosomal protein n=1 Tax=Peptoanaerobacter stomatis TaxID=796937 RepID=UPI003F9F1963
MNKEKISKLVGFAMKSRNLTFGENNCLTSIKSKKAKLVFIANDVSENTKKRLLDKCNFRNIKTILIFDRYELGNMIGREFSACLAITDNNFCNGILEQLGGEAIGKEESIYNC